MTADFAAKWFVLYYPLLGLIFFIAGAGLMIKTEAAADYLLAKSENDRPPKLLRNILKYFFLFSLTCLILSFIPFSWAELLFSIWSLIIVFIAGNRLVRWPQSRQTIKNQPDKLEAMIKRSAAIMVAVGLVMFLLCYLVIQQRLIL